MKWKRMAAAVGALVAVTGCNATVDKRPMTGLQVEPAEQRAGAALFVAKTCPVTGGATVNALGAGVGAAAVGGVAPIVADFAVNLITDAIEREAEGLSGQFRTAGMRYLDADGPYTCLVIARGLFQNGADGNAASENGLDAGVLRDLALVDQPAFYMEVVMEKAEDTGDTADDVASTRAKTPVTMRPAYIQYGQSVAPRTRTNSKHVGVVIAVTEAAAGDDAPDAEDATALYRLDLGRLEIGKSYRDASGSGLLTAISSTQALALNNGDDIKAANITAYVTESEEPGPVLKALSATAESQSEKLVGSLTEVIKQALATDTEDE